MARKCFSLYLSVCLIATLFAFSSFPVSAKESLSPNNDSPVTLEQANQVLQSSSNFFTENKGQWDPEILFVGQTDFGKVAFTQDAVYYQLVKTTHTTKDCLDPNEIVNHHGSKFKELTQGITKPWSDNDRLDEFTTPPIVETQTIKLSFVNAQTPTIQGKTLLPHYNNYFIGNDPDHWGIHCNNYTQVNYTNVWDNIDLSYFFTPQGMKYEYYVHPGADIQDLQVQVIGADLLSNKENLELLTPLGNLKDDQLLVYGQDSLLPFDASFQVHNDIFSFNVNNVCRDETIVIDPIVYSTYLGGNDYDNSWSVAIDNAGNAYISGFTYSSDFPMESTIEGTLAPGYDQTHNGACDAFVVKLNPSGTELLYSTYLGGNEKDEARDIAIDNAGNAYISGFTYSSDFPMESTIGGTLAPGYDQTHNGACDAFVVKLNPSGTELFYSTYLGGNSVDVAQGVTFDNAGNAFVSGYTYSSDFPMESTIGGTLAPGYDQTHNGSNDAFVVKLNSAGTELLYSTYLGGIDREEAKRIAIDNAGNAFISGYTYSSDFPMESIIGGTLAPGYDQTHNGSNDAFVVKLNSTGTELLYSTYLGGIDRDEAIRIAIDNAGNAFVSGYTYSSDFPMESIIGGTLAPGYDQTHNGSYDAFVVKLNPSGTELLYSTYLGGYFNDYASVAIDNKGNAFITGTTYSSDFPMESTIGGTLAPGYDQTHNGACDAFVVKLNPSGTELLYSTYLGGIDGDEAHGVIVDNEGNAYITGMTHSSDFPMESTIEGSSAPGYDQSFNGSSDAFVLKLSTSCPELSIETTTNKNIYRFTEDVHLQIKLCNYGGMATSSDMYIELPEELTYVSCDDYTVFPDAQNLYISIGTLHTDEIIVFTVNLEVTTEIKMQKNVPVILELTADECDSYVQKTTNIILAPPPCPELYVESAPNKTSYYFREMVYLNVTLRNLGGQATHVTVDVELSQELTYAGCDKYRATAQGNHLSIAIGDLDTDEVIRFVLYLEVTTDVQKKKSAPIVLDMYAKECDAFSRKIVNITLEPKRTGQQNLDVSVKLLNLKFDEETGQYYLPFDQELEMQLQVSGYETHYNYTIHWGDGETTALDKESSATILLKHKFTAKGSMNIKITIQDPGGREKTSTLYVTVK